MSTKELIEELVKFETHCIETDQLQVAELVSNAHKTLEQLQAKVDAMREFAVWLEQGNDLVIREVWHIVEPETMEQGK